MKNQEFELTTFDLELSASAGSDLPDIAVHNPITGNYMWLCHKNDFVDLFQAWSADQMAECKMVDPELMRAELWFNSEYSHLIQDQPGCLVGIHYAHLCAEMGLIERIEDLDLDQWCQSRETDQAIAKAIFELAVVPAEAQEIWESPYSLEEKIVSRAFELTEENKLQWGQESYER